MTQRVCSYLSPKLEARDVFEGQLGVFALEPIRAGELVLVWGGDVVTGAELEVLTDEDRRLSVQIEEDLYLVSFVASPADRINHSCDPNAGLNGQIAVVALRNIEAGEQVCFDYATSDSSPYDEFDCLCGSPQCRGRVTGNDWQLPELQERYHGYFMPYLQRRIDQMQAEMLATEAFSK
jgi:uncharacterized protein